jgi:hypothetical protein
VKPIDITPFPLNSRSQAKKEHEGSKILTISPYVSELKSKAAKKKKKSAVDQYGILDLGSDDEDYDDDDVPVIIAVMCSVIRNHEKSGLSALDIPYGHIMNVQDFQSGQTNLHVTSSIIQVVRHFVHIYLCKMA